MRTGLRPAAATAWTATWVAALVLATGLGVLAVRQVGDAVRGRGPLGPEVIRVEAPGAAPATPAPGIDEVRRDLTHEFGTFTVLCQGPFASGVGADPAPGWQVVRFEPGPDDDVEVVFASAKELVELEAFCNRGVPDVAELDRSRVTGSTGGR